MALEIDPNVTVLCEGDFPAVEAKLVIKNFGDMMTLNPRSPYIMTPGKSISSKFKKTKRDKITSKWLPPISIFN